MIFLHLHYFQLSYHHPWFSVTCLFVGSYFPMLLLSPFIMIVVWMAHVNSKRNTFRIVFGEPIQILAINIVKYLNITIVGLPYFSVCEGLVSVTSSSLDCCNYRSFIFPSLMQTSC